MSRILIQAENIEKQFASRSLFENVNFSIFEGEKLALYGPNGSGKTSLFKMLVNELESSAGEFHRSRGLVMGYLKQSHKKGLELTADEYLEKYESHLNTWEVKKIAAGLGFEEEHFDKKLEAHSGGFRMRFYLACELAKEPDLLLLDEPTNHLDLESVLFLEDYLQNFKKAFVLISHDRELLGKVCDHCLVIEDNEVLKYKGDLESYFQFQVEQRELQKKLNKKLEDKRKHLEAFVEKFRAKASKAKQAQSKIKQLDRLGEVSAEPAAYFRSLPIPEAHRTGKLVLEANCKAGLGYPDKPKVLDSFEFHLFRGDKIAIVGANGVGKTTLLKYLAGSLHDNNKGHPKYYKNVEASYFAQHLEQALPLKECLIDYISSKIPKEIPEQEVLDLMGAMGFRDQELDKKIELFSGGERMRIVLGEILLRKSPLLLLDEPTNHLDFETVESLAVALQKTDCTVVLVSHDRSFVDRVCDKIFEIKEQNLGIYPGNYQEYIWSKRNSSKKSNSPAQDTQGAGKVSSSTKKSFAGNYKHEKKRLEKKITQLMGELDTEDQALKALQIESLALSEKLSDSSVEDPAALAIKTANVGDEVEKKEALCLEIMVKLDEAEQQLKELMSED